jgi:hypothetical protein
VRQGDGRELALALGGGDQLIERNALAGREVRQVAGRAGLPAARGQEGAAAGGGAGLKEGAPTETRIVSGHPYLSLL